MHPDQYFALIDQAPALDTLEMSVSDDWEQGRTVFGGLSAGLVYQVLRNVISADRTLRAITFNFVGPLASNKPFAFDWSILREGKNASQVSASIVQGGQTCLSALACFSGARDSQIIIDAPKRAVSAPAAAATPRRELPPGAPRFTKNIDLAITRGDPPFSGSDNASFEGWMRLSEAPATFSEAHIITLIDAWPPTVLQMLTRPAPASTMSWNLEFVHPHNPITPGAWLGYAVDTVQAQGGYAHTEAQIFTEAGDLIALSRQLVAVFD